MTVDEFISQFNNDNRDFVAKLFFSQDQDPTYLNNLRSDFKTKFLEPLSAEVRKIRPKDIKKIFDPFGLGDISEDLEKDFKNYRKKIKEFLDIDIPNIQDEEEKNNALRRSPMVEVGGIKDQIKDVETTPENVTEQRGFGPDINMVDFSDGSKDFLKSLMEGTFKNQEETLAYNKAFEKYFKESLAKQDELIDASGQGGFLSTLGKILAIGGIAALVISAFWDSHIKPWLEKKFDINLNFLDKFEGLVEGMAKFFTLGGLKITFGPLLSIVGNTLKSFGELIEKGLTWVFNGLFGGAGDDLAKGGAEAAAKSGIFKNFLPKLAGGLFKGIGITVLKGIPVIGSLISFYFAYDRFQKADYVGAVVDLVGGLANLLSFTPLAPLALPISLGAAALNAFLDYKAANAPDTNKAKLGIIGDMAVGLYNMIKKIPFIGGMIESVEGLWSFISGVVSGDMSSVKSGLELMTGFPLLGVLPSILLAFFDTTDSSNTGGVGSTMNLPNFLQNFKKRVGQTVLKWFSWLPTSWQKSIADFMGVPFNGSGGDDEFEGGKSREDLRKEGVKRLSDLPKNAVYSEEGMEKLKKERNDIYEGFKRATKELEQNDSFYGKFLSDRYSQSEEQVKHLQEMILAMDKRTQEYMKLNPEYIDRQLQNIKDSNNKNNEEMRRIREKEKSEKEKSEKVDDFIIHDRSRNKSYIPAANDEIVGLKPDGVIDKALKEIRMVASDINKNISNLNQSLMVKSDKTQQPTMINVRTGDSGYTGKDYLMESERDAIFNARVNWWVHAQKIRATI